MTSTSDETLKTLVIDQENRLNEVVSLLEVLAGLVTNIADPSSIDPFLVKEGNHIGYNVKLAYFKRPRT